MPAIGINAISKMAVEKSSLTQFNFIRFLCDYLAKDYNGTALGIDSEEAMKAPPAERTTIVPTILSMSDGTVKMNLNMRLWFDVNKASIEKCFDEAGKKYGFTYEIHDFLKAMTVNENEEFLRVMCQTTDGFEIAEQDLELRGPGEIFGTRQHGLPELHISDLVRHSDVLEKAKDAAKSVIDTDPALTLPENRELKRRVEKMFGEDVKLEL